jgi:hypothetical protein
MSTPSREMTFEDKVADLKGSVVAIEAMLGALIESSLLALARRSWIASNSSATRRA